MTYGYIYLTTNLVNGKKYVGQKKSSTFLGTSYLGSGRAIKSAVRKYGTDKFSVELLEEVCGNQEDLNRAEYSWTVKLNAVKSREFYNLREGGDMPGFSEETRHLIAESNQRRTGETRSEEFKAARTGKNNPCYGRKHTDEERERMRKNHVKELTPEWRSNVSKSLLGNTRALGKRWTMSNESRENVARGKRGRRIMNNGFETRRVPPDKIDEFLAEGYKFGWCKKNENHE